MGSLYIKDEETAALAAEVARRLGTTKTEAVRTALREKKASFASEKPGPAPDIIAWLRERRRTHPLPPPTGLKADKAFFDWLSGEEDVPDVPRE
ncbi:antitoxin VapB [Sphingomonas guangdongensis]|uniref:Antitoxin VapB n=1 Tax=Sphingomonas guangdongensis TaxID=1141890 RepID=A0A285QKM6_9SPHN|nr:type II toxin-antitoxin system VapB family antitoxin [Sphingomonas guangdongensis]SOB80622.1 antitoxin VapB [Sphingomonas guangdongensis]